MLARDLGAVTGRMPYGQREVSTGSWHDRELAVNYNDVDFCLKDS